MSLFTPLQKSKVITELKPSLQSSQPEPKTAPNFLQATADPRHHMAFVGRIYQVSGAGPADGHYCPFCYDSGGKLVRLHRYTKHWQCSVCEAVFYD